MANHKSYSLIKGCFRVFDYFFFAISIISLAFTLSFVLITLIDLYNLYGFNISLSKVGFERFFGAFSWCSDYLKAGFIVFPIYFALSTYRLNEANKKTSDDSFFLNNQLKPQVEKLSNQLELIKDNNKKIFDYITLSKEIIIKDIMQNEKKGEIQSKNTLEKYFKKYIQDQLCIFEDCGYWYIDFCKKESLVCLESRCIKGNSNSSRIGLPHSLESFKAISTLLFCISSSYSNFDKDIEDIYKNALKKDIIV